MTLLSDKLLTVREAANILQITPETLRGYIHAGRLKAARFGRGFRIRTEDLQILINRNTK
jgi:excisionase family DNA binding protein